MESPHAKNTAPDANSCPRMRRLQAPANRRRLRLKSPLLQQWFYNRIAPAERSE
jgi:hypothetical protein